MAGDFQLLALLGGALVGSAFILFLLSNGLAAWSETKIDKLEITYGIWRQCIFTESEDDIPCADISCPSENLPSSTCNKILAARAFVILACILSGVSGTLSIIYCAMSGDKRLRRLLLTKKALAIGSLITGIIGVALGISATMTIQSDATLRLSDAAFIGIAAIGANLLGVIVTILIKPYF
ncbi:hypothetical protein I4U23_026445 [Adineta vaga]|nr:hypothetical protein I4U23_026445 [Adineta vaga]